MSAQLSQELKSLQETVRKAQQLPRSLVWGVRIAFIMLIFVWIGGAVYLHSIVKEDERELAKIQQRQQQKEELLRREAEARQALLQWQNPQSRVQNAIDGVKK